MLAKIRKNLTKRLKKKMKGFLMIQTALALITLGAMAVSFFQIYGGQFTAMAAARNSLLAQQAAETVAEYYQMTDYDSLSSSSIPKSGTLATLFGSNIRSDFTNFKFTCTLGAEKSFTTADGTNSGNLRLATIKIMNSNESAPRATKTIPLSSAGIGNYYVKNNTKKTAGITSVSYGTDGYLYGYVNGTQKPFFADAYTKAQSDANYYNKTETYTKAQVDSILDSLKTTYLTSNYYVRNGNSSKPFTLTYGNENSSITMPEGKAIYANVLGINVPLGGGGSGSSKIEDGYIEFPGNIAMQYGYQLGKSGNNRVTFKKQFKQIFSVSAQRVPNPISGNYKGPDWSDSDPSNEEIYLVDNTGFSFRGSYLPSSGGVLYIAWGKM